MKKLVILFLSLLPITFQAQITFQKQTLNSQTKTAEECFLTGKDYYDIKDYTHALEWFLKAAKQGNAKAQFHLGFMYDIGNGVKKDITKAVEWYQKAANQGLAGAQSILGNMYHTGNGVTKDYAKAVEWYQKAANQREATAQCYLGEMYQNGNGVEKNYTKAVEWYQKASNQGNARAQFFLGYMYENGNGVEKDYTKAVEWYQKSANQGFAGAQIFLGYMYENGNGVKKDFAKAYEWYQKAANQGNPNAKDMLASLQKKMAEENYILVQTTDESLTKEEIKMVDTDIPVIKRVNRNTFALIFANENYKNCSPVDYAQNDGEVFREYCQKTLGLPEQNVHFMPDATLNDLIGELDWLQQICETYKGEASIIFYYAGHGIPDEASGSAYLLPTDGKSHILRTCFSIEELYNTLGSIPAKRVTVLLDACFSGAQRSGGMLASARGVAIKAKTAAPKGNMIVLTASQGDETAYKYDEAKHGLFTFFLLKKLKDSKGSVTMGELSDYILDQVGRYSIVENRKKQTPCIMISDRLRNNWKGVMFY